MTTTTTTPTVTYEGKTFEVEITTRPQDVAEHRIYLWGVPDPDMERPEYSQQCRYKPFKLRKKQGYGRNALPVGTVVSALPGPHVESRCKQCAIDAEWRRYNREEIRIHKELVREILPGGDKAKLAFSRYAGCSCPCSPGIVVKEGFGAFPRYSSTSISLKEVTA